ncbi:MAG TPA: ABC transporter permease [Thermoanaerobaculia bacterium]|nr:ABC transporter permease [Thermoanaerobaculia bacterium]
MLVFETLRVALDALLANKLRSVLTMLGVVIGIAAVITMVALGEGAQRSVEDRLSSLGSNVLTVRAGQSGFGGGGRGQAQLTLDDAEALREAAGGAVAAVAPEMESRLQVEAGAANGNLEVVGTWPAWFRINTYPLAAGRLFTDAEDRGRRRVVVLGALAGEALGVPTASLLGGTVRIGGVPFQVIGILAEKGSMGFSNPDEALYVPLGTAALRVMGSDRVRSILVQAASEGEMDDAMAAVDRVLRREHRLRPGAEADFNVRDQATLLATMQETTRTFTFLLAGIAAISLLVGGIGIMNIMLVSVTERTREIGLRKSLGARRRDILLQFLIEAVVLCLAGGALGLTLGFSASWLLQRLAGWQMAVAPEAVLLAMAFSAAVGIFFGLWPARRAAALAPIEALRYE